jgi:hypothetical protein
MSTSRRRARLIHRVAAIPLAKQFALEEFATLDGVSVVSMTATRIRKRNPYLNHVGVWQVNSELDVTLDVGGRAESSTYQRLPVELPVASFISADGVLDVKRLRECVVRTIDQERRIGFRDWDFRASMRANKIPDGMYVEVQCTDLDSTEMTVRLFSAEGVMLIHHTFPIGPKVVSRDGVEILTGTELDYVTTFTKNCVLALIDRFVNQTPIPAPALMVSGQVLDVTDEQRQDYNRSAQAMVEDFDQHGGLVKSFGIRKATS